MGCAWLSPEVSERNAPSFLISFLPSFAVKGVLIFLRLFFWADGDVHGNISVFGVGLVGFYAKSGEVVRLPNKCHDRLFVHAQYVCRRW